MKSKSRNINLDLIRCFAVFSLISVHFFLNNGFYDVALNGKSMIVMTYLRNFFIICVPLFMILTGYLMGKKELSKKYYLKIDKIIFVYFICSLLCIIYKSIMGECYSLKLIVKSILDFSGADYSWYINMYLGLYLIIPFLNIIYNNLQLKKEKQFLILMFSLLTFILSVINAKWQIIPNWWTGIYPITYYFIGMYLREYGLKISKFKNLIIIIFLILLTGTLGVVSSYSEQFVWPEFCGFYGLFTATLSILTFNFFININLKKIPNIFKKMILKISSLSLSIYLLSYIFDQILYKYLNSHIRYVCHKAISYFWIVPLVFIFSTLLAYFVELLKKGIIYFHKKIIEKNKRRLKKWKLI